MNSTEVTIFLVEDDDVDATTVVRGLTRADIPNPVVRVRDGIEAMETLLGTNGKRRLMPPYILLVDVSMPRLDGLGLIRRIRSNKMLQRSIIFVLTTSDSDRDRAEAYDAHVAGYIVKSSAPDHFHALARMLDYYLTIVAPPPMDLCG
jgi:CheY-like chemotaxis protein